MDEEIIPEWFVRQDQCSPASSMFTSKNNIARKNFLFDQKFQSNKSLNNIISEDKKACCKKEKYFEEKAKELIEVETVSASSYRMLIEKPNSHHQKQQKKINLTGLDSKTHKLVSLGGKLITHKQSSSSTKRMNSEKSMNDEILKNFQFNITGTRCHQILSTISKFYQDFKSKLNVVEQRLF